MEGVFGEYVQDAILKGKATAVLLLDTPFETCKAQVTLRGGNHGTIDTEDSREKLFKYAAGYYTRDDARSEKGHQQILQDAKARGLQTAILRSREEVARFLQVAKTRVTDLLQCPHTPPPTTTPTTTTSHLGLEFDGKGEQGGEMEGERDGKGVRVRVRGSRLGPEGIAFAMRAHGV